MTRLLKTNAPQRRAMMLQTWIQQLLHSKIGEVFVHLEYQLFAWKKNRICP